MAHTDHHGAHGVSPDASIGHETSDADVSGVGKTLLYTGIFVAMCFVFIWFMFGVLRSDAVTRDSGTSPAVPREGDRRPPLPRLQVRPTDELTAFRQQQQETLDTWEWSNPEHTLARVPVGRAMDMVAEHGLPEPPAPPAAAAEAAQPAGTPAPGTAQTPAAVGAPAPAASAPAH
ncbi:MAG: hypothetical protein AB7I50_05315 [Vicinamibacterales bacterium]